MKEKNQKSITEVFGKLLARLNQLELYHERIDYDELPEITYTFIDQISTEVYNYPPKDALKITNFSLIKIQNLLNKGESIMNGVYIEKYDERSGAYNKASPIQIENTKKQLYKNIWVQLMYLNSKLQVLKESLLLNIEITKNSHKNTKWRIPIDELALDMRQFALLFSYLKEGKVIQPLPNDGLAQILISLSGFADPKIRTTKGLGAIAKIKSDEVVSKKDKGDTVCYNLKSVKGVLTSIIEKIDKEIRTNSRKMK